MRYCIAMCCTMLLSSPADTSVSLTRLSYRNERPISFTARSISEEFSSGDTRYRDNGESTSSTHSRDPRSPKEKEDKERGDEGISIRFMWLILHGRPVTDLPYFYRDGQGVRRRQFPQTTDISRDLGAPASYHRTGPDISTSCISYYERS